MRESRVWGVRERLFERAVPLLTDNALAALVEAAHLCDGLVKGLRHPDWPHDPWEGLRRLVLMLIEALSSLPAGSGRVRVAAPHLALRA